MGGHAQPGKRPREASPALSLSTVEDLAVTMFAVGADKPMAASRALAGASGPTVGLAVLVKQAVVKVWKQRGGAICRSPERPDLKMSQEEAQGWLVAAVVNRELLADEARLVGKRVDNYSAAEEKAQKAANDKYKSKRKAARQKKPPLDAGRCSARRSPASTPMLPARARTA